VRVWVTGLAGFLGSHLAEACLAAGYQVDGNDSLICGDEANVPKKLSYTLTDCRNYDAMLVNFRQFQPDVVVHCAATAHEGLSNFSPSFITKNIYEASVTTFSAAIAAGVKRIVYMSSMSRYGNGQPAWILPQCKEVAGPPFKEWYNPNPIDPYGIAKVAAEDTLRILCKTHGVKYAIAVPHNLAGIRQKYDDPARNVASIMINRCLQGKPPIVYGDGKQKRCFSPVKDALPSLMKMIDGAADSQVVNIGPDKGEITVNELAYKIIDLTDFDGVPIHFPDRPNEAKEAYCSSDKARRILGYTEQQTFDDCLKEMVEDIKRRGMKPFNYFFPIEIEKGCPTTWLEKKM
jgi:UDP-glucose 4-epimerase